MVLAQMCNNFCDAVFQSKCVTMISEETCQNRIKETVPIGLNGNYFKVVLPYIFFQLPHFCSRIVGCFLQGNQNFLRYPLGNENHFWPAGLLLKGVCLQQVIKAGVNIARA